jgi:hypothetical protein
MPLDQLLGTWDLTMDHDSVDASVSGCQIYERVLDGAYVRLDWTYEHPDFPNALALLSEDAMHYFDVRGITRVFEVDWDDSGWTMVHLDPVFSQRFTSRVEGPELVITEGEYSEDEGATWLHDFRLTLRRTG